uniref:Uncharacterized protein n=1 Tax=Ralstonia solanacearum TaxID=305 RepID=A0A0S4WPI0_RALSL|nr:protein of unknown function [Ralstonia solanacearum]
MIRLIYASRRPGDARSPTSSTSGSNGPLTRKIPCFKGLCGVRNADLRALCRAARERRLFVVCRGREIARFGRPK